MNPVEGTWVEIDDIEKIWKNKVWEHFARFECKNNLDLAPLFHRKIKR